MWYIDDYPCDNKVIMYRLKLIERKVYRYFMWPS